jgi:hypothetical protein
VADFGGSRFSVPGSDLESEKESDGGSLLIAIKVAMQALSDVEITGDVSAPDRPMRLWHDLVQNLWEEIGYPPPASCFWERGR